MSSRGVIDEKKIVERNIELRYDNLMLKINGKRKRFMKFTVKDMLAMELFQDAGILWGQDNIFNEISGVTIIEAPDIVRFINGGEVLLTGLNAFYVCSPEEFRDYMNALAKTRVSALVLKRGRQIDYLEEKMEIIGDYSKGTGTPVIEIPFEVPFRNILSMIMERLFNEEIVRLKYFKTTHDNFTALSLSFHSVEDGVQRILEVLEKLIGNPVAVFDQNFECLATTDAKIRKFSIQSDIKDYVPEFYSIYKYRKQEVILEDGKEYGQFPVRMNVMYNLRMYLTITEINHPVSSMDFIAIENAVTALKQELFRQNSLKELKKQFQSDIVNNILNGRVLSLQELQKDCALLEIPVNENYRVIAFDLASDAQENDLNEKVKYSNILYNAIAIEIPNIKIQNNMDKVIVIQQVDMGEKQEDYRRTLQETIMKIQRRLKKTKKDVKLQVGVGKLAEGAEHISESYKEAMDSLIFIDVLGEPCEEEGAKSMFFSDMGIFKFICQLTDKNALLEYIPESLQKLLYYKKQQRQDLILTLKTYLEHNQNLSKTAQDLYIHYKTAAYRMERIEEITGIDFNNSNEILSVRIGLVVYKMLENMRD